MTAVRTAGDGTPAGATRRLASFAAGLSLDAVPVDVAREARRALVDWLAAALSGAAEPATGRLLRVMGAFGDRPEAGLVGRRERTSAPVAALVNAYASHLQDYDDTYNPGQTTVHGSAPVWPVILAASEVRPVPGRLALAAFVAGFETEARVGHAAGASHYDVGWHVTGTAGHLGAAAAAARLLGLAAEPAAHALGLAATQAAGLKEVYGSDSKALHPGKAAMDGLLAGMLAAEGFTASPTVLEGRYGLLRVMSRAPDPDALTAGLGETWHLRGNGYKAYPSGSLTHPAVDALLQLRDRHGLDAGAVASVTATVSPEAARVTGKPRPRTGLEAKFSLVHAAAVTLRDGRPGLRHFTDPAATDPEVVALRDRVEVVMDEGLGKRSARVRVRLRDGRDLEASVEHNLGTPANPLSDRDLEVKLLDSAGPLLGAKRAEALLADCWRAEDLEDFGVVARGAAGRP